VSDPFLAWGGMMADAHSQWVGREFSKFSVLDNSD